MSHTILARTPLVLRLTLAMFLTACNSSIAQLGATPTPTCADQVRPYLDQIQSVAREWDDANKLAGSAPRMSLAPQVASLQALRRRAADLNIPPCANAAHRKLIDSMDKTIEGYLSFLSQKPDSVVADAFHQADVLMNDFTTELGKLQVTETPTQ